MAEGVLGKLVTWVILILFILLFTYAFLNPKFGLIQKVSRIAIGFEKFLPDQPQKELTQDDSLPDSTIRAQERFLNEISRYTDQSNCLLEFSDVSGLGSTKLEMINFEGSISTRIEKPAGKGETGGILLNPIPLKDSQLQICTINPEAFYGCAIGKNFGQCGSYTSVDSVSLSKDSIIVSEGDYPYAKGILFKPQNDRACFIPLHSYTGGSWYKFWQSFTRFGCEASESTIDDDCVEEMKKNIISCESKEVYESLETCESVLGTCRNILGETTTSGLPTCLFSENLEENLKCRTDELGIPTSVCCVPK